jgi:short-subunit dehydrogenase/acyl carrier protein
VLGQALGEAGIGAKLWAVTCGAVAAGETGPVRVAQAMVWGLGRSVALEHPHRWGGLVDVPQTLTGRAARWLRAVLSGRTGEDQVAIRQAAVLGRRLVRAPASGMVARRWRPSGAVLITGGTGALGGHVARWLAARGSDQMILTSRRGIAVAGAAGLAARLAGAGSGVTVAACDAGDRASLTALWARLAAARMTVRAVVHAAGVLDDGVIDALTPARLAGVLGAKAAAARNLDELTADRDLDAFVLFSSMAGVVGSAGQGNYAAANAALDAIAEDRRARGLAAVSVGWGPWAGGGMVEDAVATRAARGGLAAMAPRAAVSALGRILDLGQADAVTEAAGAEDAAVMVADVDWARFAPGFTGSRPSLLLTGVAEAQGLAGQQAGMPGPDTLRQQLMRHLAGASDADYGRIVLDLIRTQAAGVLGYPSVDEVGSELGFLELGFDSLTIVELRNRLNAATGMSLPSTLVFDFPTPAALAQHLRSELIAAGQMGADAGGKQVDQAQETAAGQLSTEVDRQPEAASGGLNDLYERTLHDGKADDFLKLMQDLAQFRPSFDKSDAASVVQPTWIARGPAQPSLICLPSFVGKSDVFQYARLAAGFRGTRDVSVLPHPGFLPGELLPANMEALLAAYASAVQKGTDGGPFVLVGYSVGGLVAHILAAYLETIGIPPDAVVLIDSYSIEDGETWWETRRDLEQTMIARNDDTGDAARGDSWITAMARYFAFDWWDVVETAVPALLVRAADPVSEVPAGVDWNVSWRLARTVTMLAAPGNHFTLIRERAASTAQIINEWLTANNPALKPIGVSVPDGN